MSVDIDWMTITAGQDGEALAENIRAFIHDKFQQITLPRFINSVHVHSFSFGDVCPEIEIKDICDPLPDFYEDDDSEPEQIETEHNLETNGVHQPVARVDQDHLRRLQEQILHSDKAESHIHSEHTVDPRHFSSSKPPSGLNIKAATQHGLMDHFGGHFPRIGTPGIPGGTSNLSYFHLPLGGPSGTQTPLAAVASGTPFPPAGWHFDMQQQYGFALNHPAYANASQRQDADDKAWPDSNPPTRPSTADSMASPPDIDVPFSPRSLDGQRSTFGRAVKVSDDPNLEHSSSPPPRLQPSQPSDLQVVARVKYAGNVQMTLTAEILLDYPMPSFVGIPLKLSITGMTFDGVAILAYIRKRMHFCFLSPEDADALVGDRIIDERKDSNGHKTPTTGLLQEIHVESEIGRKENGKQVLKNVGKVEKFVLEQVRRIFEEEFVFPSYYTFLV